MTAGPSWARAWGRALYGPDGFYVTGAGPAAHFRTASHAAPSTLARAMAGLADRTGCDRVVDVAAGRGELLTALATVAPGLELCGVDLVPRPVTLPDRVGWVTGPAPDALPDLFSAVRGAVRGAGRGAVRGAGRSLVTAWEWLDVVPCPVVETGEDGLVRTVHVDPGTGLEALGDPPPAEERAWLDAWWPLEGGEPGLRAEVGLPRDRAWAGLVAACPGAVLLAVDYDHGRRDRPPAGSLSAFRAGRAVPPVPDGACDLTAHVALDAVRAAGERAGATTLDHRRQHEALRALLEPADLDGEPGSAELVDPAGLGGFGWLLQVAPGA